MTTAGTGTITKFSGADGLGEILLADGTVVRFGTSACQGFRGAISVGQTVRADRIAVGFGGRLRAGVVTQVGESCDLERSVFGLDASIVCDDVIAVGKKVRLVPLDLAEFAQAHPEWTDARALRRRAFGRTLDASSPAELPPIFAPYRTPILATGIGAALLAPSEDAPAVGSSFIGGDFADLGEEEWPTDHGRPMLHLAQIGTDLASSLGLNSQVNVFVSSIDGEATVRVCATAKPSRARHGKSALPARTLTVRRWATAFPGVLTLTRLGSGARAFFELWVATPQASFPAMSVQALYERTFPPVTALTHPIVAGGYAETDDAARLLTVDVSAFPELTALRRSEDGTTIGIELDPSSGRAVIV